LVATSLIEEHTLNEALVMSTAPSARVLLRNRKADSQRTGVYLLGNPYPVSPVQALKWSSAEALTLALLVAQLGLPSEVRVEWNATRTWLLEALQNASIVDVSCHGMFDERNFLRSCLFLANDETLTLADTLSYQV